MATTIPPRGVLRRRWGTAPRRGLRFPLVFAAPATAGGAADRLLDALAGAHAGLLAAAVALHVGGQLCRGRAWRGVLSAAWPVVTRRRACAWHVCGAGLSGVLSARGGDAVRIALARRQLDGATWPALAGTLAAEGSFETVFALVVALLALRFGVGSLALPSAPLLAGLAVAAAVLVLVGARAARGRGVGGRGGRACGGWRARSAAAWRSCAGRGAGRCACCRGRSPRECCGSGRRRASCSRSGCPPRRPSCWRLARRRAGAGCCRSPARAPRPWPGRCSWRCPWPRAIRSIPPPSRRSRSCSRRPSRRPA